MIYQRVSFVFDDPSRITVKVSAAAAATLLSGTRETWFFIYHRMISLTYKTFYRIYNVMCQLRYRCHVLPSNTINCCNNKPPPIRLDRYNVIQIVISSRRSADLSAALRRRRSRNIIFRPLKCGTNVFVYYRKCSRRSRTRFTADSV